MHSPEHALQQVEDTLDQAKRQLTDVNERVVAFIKERPAACLLGAVAIGFLVGRLAARA